MPAERKPMRYGHTEGHTDVCFDHTGKYVEIISTVQRMADLLAGLFKQTKSCEVLFLLYTKYF